MMAKYFTLDPAYEHYEPSDTNLAFRTVYNKHILSRFSSWNFVVGACMIEFAFVVLLVRGDVRLGQGIFDILVLGLVTLAGWFLLALARTYMTYEKTRGNLKLLRSTGILLDGTLLGCVVNTKPAYWRGDVPRKYLIATFQFTNPDQQRLQGTQIRMLEERKQSFPPATTVRFGSMSKFEPEKPMCAPQGTPIRVLYADPETYVML